MAVTVKHNVGTTQERTYEYSNGDNIVHSDGHLTVVDHLANPVAIFAPEKWQHAEVSE